jgi:hypothetical protein
LLGCGLDQVRRYRRDEKKTGPDCKMENGYNTVFIQTSDSQHRRFELGRAGEGGRELEANTVT